MWECRYGRTVTDPKLCGPISGFGPPMFEHRTEVTRYERAESLGVTEAGPTLDRRLDVQEGCTVHRLTIGDHTVEFGDVATDAALSRDSAEIVSEAAHARGVRTSQMVPVGRDDANPILDNCDEGGRQLNRRITLELDNR